MTPTQVLEMILEATDAYGILDLLPNTLDMDADDFAGYCILQTALAQARAIIKEKE